MLADHPVADPFQVPAVDWDAFVADLGPIPWTREAAELRSKSRDFYWYSPILKAQLKDVRADCAVMPRDVEEVRRTVALCAARRIPITVRGAGTGNYGQAMPIHGGVVLDLRGLHRIGKLEHGILTVEPGAIMEDIERATRPQGWELRFHPSTKRTATIGGFIAGGSSGIGSINFGLLRDRGAILGLKVMTMEEEPRIIELRGDRVLWATHAYGCNGIIVEVELPMAPAWPWAEAIVSFDGFMDAMRFGDALAHDPSVVKKLISPIAAPVPQQYFRQLQRQVSDAGDIVITMVAETSWEGFEILVREHGGRIVYSRRAGQADALPPLYEFTWNHTTLQALKETRQITYLQTLFAPGEYLDRVAAMIDRFGDEVPMHCEFVNLGGRIGVFGLQLVRYTTDARLREIIAIHEAEGCPIFDPHTYILEDGGMKQIDQDQLAFKREADPLGLLNPGKMRAWWQG